MADEQHAERKKQRSLRSFLDSYWFEFTVVGLVGLGIFLLLERLEIKASAWRGLMWLAHGVANTTRSFAGTIRNVLHQVETSDLVGIGLILVALTLVVAKMRLRAIRRHPSLPKCPRCSGRLERIRSRLKQRLLGFILLVRIKHYSCTDCPFHTTVWGRRRE